MSNNLEKIRELLIGIDFENFKRCHKKYSNKCLIVSRKENFHRHVCRNCRSLIESERYKRKNCIETSHFKNNNILPIVDNSELLAINNDNNDNTNNTDNTDNNDNTDNTYNNNNTDNTDNTDNTKSYLYVVNKSLLCAINNDTYTSNKISNTTSNNIKLNLIT